jgi:hypothetical protein
MPHAENMMHKLKNQIKLRQDTDLNSVLNLSCKPARKKAARKVVKKKTKTGEGRQPSLAPFVGNGFELQRVYKKKTYRASVTADGIIHYAGKQFGSPSLAAVAVTGRSINGWKFWSFKDASGKWVKLDALRK